MAVRSVSVGKIRIVTLLAGTCAAFLVSALHDSAEARGRHRRARVAAAPAYAPPFSAIVVDANSGRVLFSHQPDALRHPASITKVMTLYMLFEQLEKRKLSLSTEIEVSAHAASMPPTKLGLRPGSTITIENAIRAIVTKSANDMAAAVGEAIGGSEERFAQMMNQKAKSLGMTRTNFENASGLPNPDQVTTAHDLAILGRAMREKFPQYYHYFGASSFQVGRAVLRNHNRLLGRVEGVDGIKTGYTRASGFNLLTSARRGNRRIVAVVLGGPSAARRDAIMASLVERHIDGAASARTVAAISERDVPAVEAPAARPPARPEMPRQDVAAAETPATTFGLLSPATQPAPVPPTPVAPAPQPQRRAEPEATGRPLALAAYARTEPARPAVISAAPRTGDLIPTATIPMVADGSTRARAGETPSVATGSRSATPSNLRWVTGPMGVERGKPAPARPEFSTPPAPMPASAAAPAPAAQPAAPVRTARLTPPAPVPAAEKPNSSTVPMTRPAAASQGVIIQIGATDNQERARELLDRARNGAGGALAHAKPFTEPVSKGGGTLYRARFAGLDEKSAEAACRTLKRSGFGCFTTRN